MTVFAAGITSHRSRTPIESLSAWVQTAVVHWAARCLFAVTGNGRAAEIGGVSAEEMISRFQRGQPRMFEAIFDRYKDYVYRVAFFVLRHREEAEEATQETFLDLLRALPNYDIHGPARFETWLYRVTVNRCKMHLRHKTPPSTEWEELEESLERLPANHTERPETIVAKRESAVALWKAVDALPEDHRMAVLLRYQQELSYDEISQVLGVKVGTVKSRLYNAHCKLKQWLEERHLS
ncbi:MAG: RNA polymerase sigma factor [Anaerolineae bacterium]|nr:RNA polymerase sigma factor [Anaerolineae bacterium]